MATAWAPILLTATVDEKSGTITDRKVIPVGGKVSKSDVGDDWDYLVQTGVIRNEEYPVKNLNVSAPESPRDVIIRKAKRQMQEAQGTLRLAMRPEPDVDENKDAGT